MNKKYRLEIVFPVSKENFSMAHWIKQTELNNKTCVLKDGVYIFDVGDGEDTAPRIEEDDINHDWLTEIKEPLEFKEWNSQQDYSFLQTSESRGEEVWQAAIENDHLRIKQALDSAKKEYFDEHCNGDDAYRIQVGHVWNSIVAILNLEPEDDND